MIQPHLKKIEIDLCVKKSQWDVMSRLRKAESCRIVERTAGASEIVPGLPQKSGGQPAQETIRSHVPDATPKSQIFLCLRDKRNLYISDPIFTI